MRRDLVATGLLLVVVLTSCRTVHIEYLEVKPARSVSALAGKANDKVHGIRCKRVCSSTREHDRIDWCALATFAVNPELVCTVAHTRDGKPEERAYSLAIPAGVTLTPSPAGEVSIGVCKAAGCEATFDRGATSNVITECHVSQLVPDAAAPHLVCAFSYDRKPTTM